jgi:hypothetical protein
VDAVAETTTETTHIQYKPEGRETVHEVDTEISRQNLTIWHLIGTIVIPISGGVLIAWAGF